MIKYRSEQANEDMAIGYRRILFSVNPLTLFLFGLFCILWALISDLFGEFTLDDIPWIVLCALLLVVVYVTVLYRAKVLPVMEKVRINVQKYDVQDLQEDEYTEDGINHTLFSFSFHFNYSEINAIYFFSDIIIVRRKRKAIFYYTRNSFINATEEEWLQFMLSKNPKIKVRRFKTDYIWYF